MVRLTVHAGPCSSYHFTYPTAILCGVWLGRRISLSHTPASSATSACLVLSCLKDWGQKNSYSRATAMRSSPKVVWRDSILQRHKGVIWGCVANSTWCGCGQSGEFHQSNHSFVTTNVR